MAIQFSLRRAFRDTRAAAALPDINFEIVEERPATIPARTLSSGIVGHYVARGFVRPTTSAVVEPPAATVRVDPIGRGTMEHAAAVSLPSATPIRRRARRLREGQADPNSIRERLLAAALAAAIMFAGMASAADAEQYRYRVQPGDSLEGVAGQFGVDPDAISRSSWFSTPGELTAGDVVIIPEIGQSPSDAAAMAAERAGTSPWAAGAHWVVAGDTIESIAATYGVAPQSLLDANGLTWSEYIYAGDRLIIPGGTDGEFSVKAAVSTTGDVPGAAAPSGARVWVPTHVQERSLSCEYAAAYIATSAFGSGVPEWAFNEAIPVTLNPHFGYRGDIDGAWGGYDDWGIYAEPMVPVLNAWGFAAEPFYSMGDAAQLIAQLDAGRPVVVWLAMWGDTGRVYRDEGTYTVFAGSHVMTAYGYDDAGVYLSDPGTGSYRFYDWATFTWMWGAIDGMSLAIYPY